MIWFLGKGQILKHFCRSAYWSPKRIIFLKNLKNFFNVLMLEFYECHPAFLKTQYQLVRHPYLLTTINETRQCTMLFVFTTNINLNMGNILIQVTKALYQIYKLLSQSACLNTESFFMLGGVLINFLKKLQKIYYSCWNMLICLLIVCV